MTDVRRISKLVPSALCHLPFVIFHLPCRAARNHVSPPVPCRPAPASARRRFRDRDFPPETHAGPRAVEPEAAGGACIEEVRAGGTARIVNSARARRQQARPPRRECGRRHGEPPGRAGRDGPAPKSRLPPRAGSMACEIPRNPAALRPGHPLVRNWARNALPPPVPLTWCSEWPIGPIDSPVAPCV